ncbi:MAG: biotin--[acetyl-CoA-carboxylase] ligase [Peptostreptococcaceae bacterium]|nr:biotin--[acetyl-CoA-carboxylase] ligase [Peptostreptococcaceae bacterium]
MKTDEKVLTELLKNAKATYISGESLAKTSGVSRNSIWKAIEKLKKNGYPITSSRSKGYKLEPGYDILSKGTIKGDVTILSTLPSTNDYIKHMDYSDSTQIVIADEQTKGKGRLGRYFFSPKGTGIYMSYSFKPKFTPDDTMLITCGVANVVHDSIKTISGKDTQLKWVNDIFLNGKKICGILTEGEFNLETNLFDRIIIGIGINCFPSEVPDDLKDIIGFLSETAEVDYTRNDLIADIIKGLDNLFIGKNPLDRASIISNYRKNCFVVGKIVTLNTFNSEPSQVEILDIGERCELIVKYLDGKKEGLTENIISGEIIL